MVGKTLGHYEILGPLGAGGMGEVYRARDTKLDRDVAIKVLPEDFATDPDRLARFEREAKLLASLNHGNIAAIYGLEDEVDQRFIVMEVVEGETLAERIARSGRIEVDDALDIARQIAEALEAAHDNGVIHRDLKPANIKVKEDGTVKVLDFGLAKAIAPDPASAAADDLANSPTLTARATQMGVVLGTAAYMAPEQAKGKPVDKRADIWAFGVVLFEMLTGTRPFDGSDVSEVMAAVIKDTPPFEALPAGTPAPILRLLRRCLTKDRGKRLDSMRAAQLEIGDALTDLRDGTGAGRGVVGAATATARATTGVARVVPWTVAAAALAVAAGAWTARAPEVAGSYELEISAPVDSEFRIGPGASTGFIISPDGTKLAFVATTDEGARLWVRPLAEDAPVALPGTEGAMFPFWSADSTRLAFFAGGALKKVDISGGLPEVIAEAPNGRGGSWGADGTIVFTPDSLGTVHKVAETGGEVENLTTLDTGRGETLHYWPYILPEDDRFLFFSGSSTAENSGIYVARIDGTGTPTRVVASMSSGIYAPAHAGFPGHLLWVRAGSLLAQPFDLDAGALTGSATVIATDVRVDESFRSLLASVSDDGVLAWATARSAGAVADWYDRRGLMTSRLKIEPGMISGLRMSPDGERLLFERTTEGNMDIFLHDATTDSTRAVVSGPGYDQNAVWSADGESFFYHTEEGIMIADPDDITQKRIVYAGGGVAGSGHPSVDNEYVLFVQDHPSGGYAIAAARVDGEGSKVLTEASSTMEYSQGFSPDGDWLLLSSARSGARATYAARWLADGENIRLGDPWVQVGESDMGWAQWTTDGEIVFRSAGSVMAVPVTQSGDRLELGRESRLFRPPDGAQVEIARDGQRFAVTTHPYAAGQTIRVLINWQSRLAEGR